MVGTYPYENQLNVSLELGTIMKGEMDPVEVTIPCSVQKSLLNHGLCPDWNHGMNFRSCEWVENRFWIFATDIPADWLDPSSHQTLHFEGLDFNGEIYFQGQKIYEFENALVPHEVDIQANISPSLTSEATSNSSSNELMIVFHCPPRWLGQFGYTSKISDMKPRFYYWWDWTSRLVQTGITGNILLKSYEHSKVSSNYIYSKLKKKNELEKNEFEKNGCGDDEYGGTYANGKHSAELIVQLEVKGSKQCDVHCLLMDGDREILNQTHALSNYLGEGHRLDVDNIDLWWPHGMGEQKLYSLHITLRSKNGETLDSIHKNVGFRSFEWHDIQGAPEGADPWILAVNGKEIFLTGVNWTPIRPNQADIKREDVERLLKLYQKHHIKLLRVWGGAPLESFDFYDLCDKMGFLVWQEFPLSSSGLDNCPPESDEVIAKYVATAKTYIDRRHHHACHLLWCGGNELREFKSDQNVPVTRKHPMIKAFDALVQKLDPEKRFIPSTPCGPEFSAKIENMGKGLHWAVNGPWKAEGRIEDEWNTYFSKDDSFIRTEIGAPGPSSAELIRKYAGDCQVTPCSNENDLWRRQSWWTESEQFVAEKEHEPNDLEEYVQWGQKRQSDALLIASKNCLRRFPACGGIIFWMGHDSFPCTSNTSLIDFEGQPKPALLALSELFAAHDDIINGKSQTQRKENNAS